jgi:hypothetical protein
MKKSSVSGDFFSSEGLGPAGQAPAFSLRADIHGQGDPVAVARLAGERWGRVRRLGVTFEHLESQISEYQTRPLTAAYALRQ